MNRKQRREAEKNGENPVMQEKLALFGLLPDKCTGCQSSFDKKNKEQVNSWTVMVYNETKKVILYCPTCRKDVQAWAEDLPNG